jgi:hypothetical protein
MQHVAVVQHRTFHLLSKPDLLTCYQHPSLSTSKRGLTVWWLRRGRQQSRCPVYEISEELRRDRLPGVQVSAEVVVVFGYRTRASNVVGRGRPFLIASLGSAAASEPRPYGSLRGAERIASCPIIALRNQCS